MRARYAALVIDVSAGLRSTHWLALIPRAVGHTHCAMNAISTPYTATLVSIQVHVFITTGG